MRLLRRHWRGSDDHADLRQDIYIRVYEAAARDGVPESTPAFVFTCARNLLVDRELSKVVARLDLLAAQADEKYRRAALDFSQNWFLGSLGPFLSMVPK